MKMIKMTKGASTLLLLTIFLYGHHIKIRRDRYLERTQEVATSFQHGDVMRLDVNKLTSTQALFPLDYYQFPFCIDENGIRRQEDDDEDEDSSNLWTRLSGDLITNSPYRLFFKRDLYCEQICASHLGRGQPYVNGNEDVNDEEDDEDDNAEGVSYSYFSDRPIMPLVDAIRKGYQNNWIVDNLPSKFREEDDQHVSIRHWNGFPVGYVDPETGMAYVNNHVNLEFVYTKVASDTNDDDHQEYRVLGFTVQPFSIRHEFGPIPPNSVIEYTALPKQYQLSNPIDSCNPLFAKNDNGEENNRQHTNYDMVRDHAHPQPAYGKVLFTYDVIWIEDENADWTQRWDIYSTRRGFGQHGRAILQSFVVTALLVALLATIWSRVLEQYHRSLKNEDDNEGGTILSPATKDTIMGRGGWTQLSGDVFRPPQQYGIALVVGCGVGAQILWGTVLSFVTSALGYAPPSDRSSFFSCIHLAIYMGAFTNGFVTARLLKTFGWVQNKNTTPTSNITTCTWSSFCRTVCWDTDCDINVLKMTLLVTGPFPAMTFILMGQWMLLSKAEHSTYEIPSTDWIWWLALWCLETLLAAMGVKVGYQREEEDEVGGGNDGFRSRRSNLHPRAIPKQPWYMHWFVTVAAAGLFPFLALHIPMYSMMGSMWMGFYYDTFLFGLVHLILLVVQVAALSMVLTFLQFRHEDHSLWWWKAFWHGGAFGLYVFLYAIYFQRHHLASEEGADTPTTTVALYYGYMLWFSLCITCALGCVGVGASYWFTRSLYAHVAPDDEDSAPLVEETEHPLLLLLSTSSSQTTATAAGGAITTITMDHGSDTGVVEVEAV